MPLRSNGDLTLKNCNMTLSTHLWDREECGPSAPTSRSGSSGPVPLCGATLTPMITYYPSSMIATAPSTGASLRVAKLRLITSCAMGSTQRRTPDQVTT